MEELAQSLLDGMMARYPLPHRPLLVWKNLRVSAGIAHYRTYSISLSRILLNTPERLENTLAHEYAHLLAVSRHGLKAGNHGEYWKEAMRDLGCEPSVRHTYEVQRNEQRQQVTYQCVRCGVLIFRARRLSKWRKYVHASCGGAVKLREVR